MNMKTTATAAAVLACCTTTAVQAQPPTPPAQYALGPAAPNVAFTDITDAQEEEYLLLECALKQIEGVILAKNAASQVGTYPITVQTNGLNISDPLAVGFVTVGSPGANFTISGGQLTSTFWGKQYTCFETPDGDPPVIIQTFNGVAVGGFNGLGEYNGAGTILDFTSTTLIQGINSIPGDISTFDVIDGNLIKDFYQDQTLSGDNLYDWGLQEISKNGFSQQKYWQRSKSWPSDAASGCTAIVLDRLVGPSPVRITVLIEGTDSLDWISKSGHIYITQDPPGTPVNWPIFPICSFSGT